MKASLLWWCKHFQNPKPGHVPLSQKKCLPKDAPVTLRDVQRHTERDWPLMHGLPIAAGRLNNGKVDLSQCNSLPQHASGLCSEIFFSRGLSWEQVPLAP